MTEFTLDTSGAVMLAPGFIWSDLSPFEQGYVEAMFASWKAQCDLDGDDFDVGFSDLAPETLAAIRKDCAALVSPPYVFASDADAGRFCWEWRQRGWRNATGGPPLREAFPPLTVSLGDDGKVYARAAA